MRTYKATIYYKMKDTHPDIECMSNWSPDTEYSYGDTYHMDERYFFGEDGIKDYIMEDLALVAGGGYDTNGIFDVRFDIKEVA